MQPEAGGYHRHEEADVPEGRRYAFRLDGGPERPDPCSLWQPEGVHGAVGRRPARTVRLDRRRLEGRPPRGPGLLRAARRHVHARGDVRGRHPAAARPARAGRHGRRDHAGRPVPGHAQLGLRRRAPLRGAEQLRRPARPAAAGGRLPRRGTGVFLDVVYNHLGPEGNYLGEFGRYFTDRYKTPWGAAVNYDGRGCDAVRDYVLDNVRMWLEEFHFDGLRLDAVHAIFDLGARHILRAIEEVGRGRRRHAGAGRRSSIAESDLNDPRLLYPRERGGYGLDAQWADDFHHAAHAFLTGERAGYYADFGERRATGPGAARRPFVYAWDYSPFRDRKHGAPPEGLSGDRFVVCLQNHDQVGNRPRGDRLNALLGSPAEAAAGGRVAPAVALPAAAVHGRGVRRGELRSPSSARSATRRWSRRCARAGSRSSTPSPGRARCPTPRPRRPSPRRRLSWSWPEGTPRAGLRRLYRDLLAARREWPALRDFEHRSARLLEGEAEAGPLLELVRGGDRRVDAGLFQPRRPAGPVARCWSAARSRSCSARRPRPTAAAAARPGRLTSWPRSSSLSWARRRGGPSPIVEESGRTERP